MTEILLKPHLRWKLRIVQKTSMLLKKLFILFFIIPISTIGQNVELRITLRDGSIISGTSKIGNVQLLTDYGKLDIPVKNISYIELAVPDDKSNKDKILNLLKQLANSNEELRKSAYNELSEMSVSTIRNVNDYLSSDQYISSGYTDYTPELLLNDLKSQYNLKDNFPEKDVVAMDYEFVMGGNYDFKSIELKTEYGILTLPKGKIERIDIIFAGNSEGGDKTFKLLGTKHISSNDNGGWLKTGILVKQGQKINITATGEISFASLSGSKYKPDGSIGNSASPDDYGDYDYSASTYPTYGNVVFKIGDAGVVQKAGGNFNGNANATGMLFLSVYETVYNPANTGSYNVKISVK